MTDNTPETRSEIVFMYDAQNSNPNGNPLSANDMPRIDRETQQAIVTDVRLKRYIRDQLEDDGESIYIRNPQREHEGAKGKDELFEDLFDEDIPDIVEDDDRDIFEEFLGNAADVRYFGATLAFSETVEDALGDIRVPHYTGPLQFTHGRSLNAVTPADEAKKLSSVVTSGGDAEQGTFAEDNRLEYALVRFHGVMNENAAEYTRLTERDVEQLDHLLWRSLKNQTITRSKMGHSPQFYARVEYSDGYHNGQLHETIGIDYSNSTPDDEMRSINDVTLDATDFVGTLSEEDRAETVHIIAGKYTSWTVGDETGDVDVLYDALEQPDVNVEVVDPYDK